MLTLEFHNKPNVRIYQNEKDLSPRRKNTKMKEVEKVTVKNSDIKRICMGKTTEFNFVMQKLELRQIRTFFGNDIGFKKTHVKIDEN